MTYRIIKYSVKLAFAPVMLFAFAFLTPLIVAISFIENDSWVGFCFYLSAWVEVVKDYFRFN